MATIIVRVGNANRLPLEERMDVHLVNVSTDATVKVAYDDARVELGSIKKAIEEQGYAVFG